MSHFSNYDKSQAIKDLKLEWQTAPRWQNVKRPYTAEDVIKMRGSVVVEHSLARRAADKLWHLFNGGAEKKYVNTMGTLTGGQAMQQAKAGMKALYLSGWQVAADQNTANSMYPDQSLYPVDSVPKVIRSINKTLKRADEIQWQQGLTTKDDGFIDYFLPIIADAEAGFGGILNAYELTKHMIEAGTGGVHFEDQLSSAKKCGHMGGKVIVPTREAVEKLVSARLAADVMNVPTLIIARTDANAAALITSDSDPYDRPFLTGERTEEGFHQVKAGLDQAISRGLAYAPYADLIWCETATPNLEEARIFAEAIKAEYPNQLLAYNCSPSFNWKKYLDDKTIAEFQDRLGEMGYVFQFITLAGIHNMWYHMFDFAYHYSRGEGMKHYVERIQTPELEAQSRGYTFAKHQQEVGAQYFDALTNIVQGADASTTAMKGSTEEEQFIAKAS